MAKKKYHLIYIKPDGEKVDTEVSGDSAQSVAADNRDKSDKSGIFACWPVTEPNQ